MIGVGAGCMRPVTRGRLPVRCARGGPRATASSTWRGSTHAPRPPMPQRRSPARRGWRRSRSRGCSQSTACWARSGRGRGRGRAVHLVGRSGRRRRLEHDVRSQVEDDPGLDHPAGCARSSLTHPRFRDAAKSSLALWSPQAAPAPRPAKVNGRRFFPRCSRKCRLQRPVGRGDHQPPESRDLGFVPRSNEQGRVGETYDRATD